MKTLCIVLTTLSFLFLADFELAEKSFFDSAVSVDIPTNFSELSNQEISEIYSQLSQPELAFSNTEKDVRVTLTRKSLGSKEVSQETLEGLLPILVRNIQRMEGVELHNEKMKKINDRQVGTVNYTQTDSLGSTRHRSFFTDLDGQLMMASFSCPEEKFDEWQKISDAIIESLKIADK